MATEYRRVTIFLCVCLASIHSIIAEENESIVSNEQSEADYIRLEDLIRQQLLGLVQNDFPVPNTDFLPRSMSGGTQVRHLSPRSGRLRNFLFGGGSNDDTQSTQNGGGGLLNRLKRRPSQQNNRVSGMSDYYDDGLYPQYMPTQNQNLMYDYLPSGSQYDYLLPSSGNQMVYDGYNGRPNMMWNGGGIPSGYEYVNQPVRVPGRRVGMRPIPIESYDMAGNGGYMPAFDSAGSPGSYIIQIPSRGGRRNNLNGGSPRPTASSNSQITSPTSGGPMTIPTEVFNAGDSLNTVGIPIRTGGRKNNQNQNSGMSMTPGSQTITSGNMGIPDSEVLSTNLPSTQSYTITSDGSNLEIPTDITGSGGNAVSFRLPENMNGLRVGNRSPGSTSFGVGSDGIELGGGDASNGSKIGGRGGSANSIELPIDSNIQGLATGGNVDNIQLPSGVSGLRAGLSGLTNNIKLPANLNGIRLRTGGSSDNVELPSSLGGLRVGGGKSSGNLELPIGGGGVRMGQNQITLPSSESFSLGNGDLISTTDMSNLPGSFSVSSGRAVQMTPSSVSESIQGLPTAISIDEADAQPDYDIDVRDLDESAYTSGPMESLTADAQPLAHTITQSVSGQPSESLDIMSPDMVSSVSNLVDQDDETTSLSSDMNLINGGDARTGRILGSPMRGAISQNGPESLIAGGNSVNPKRKGMTQMGGYYLIPHQNDFVDTYTNEAENNMEQLKPQMSKFSTRSGRTQQPMGNLNSKMSVGNGISETQGLDFGQLQNNLQPSSGQRMMSSVTSGDGSGTAGVGTGKSANGRSRQYKVLVLDGDHELIRGLKLPGMKTNFGDSGEV